MDSITGKLKASHHSISRINVKSIISLRTLTISVSSLKVNISANKLHFISITQFLQIKCVFIQKKKHCSWQINMVEHDYSV